MLIVGVSVAALLALAQLRFPERPVIVTPTPSPLERLAARATFDELAGSLRDLERRLAPALVVLEVWTGDPPAAPAFVPALRVRPDVAAAILRPQHAVARVAGSDNLPAVRARDADRGLVLFAVAPVGATASLWEAGEWPAGRYVAIVEAAAGAATVRPVFLAAGAAEPDPLWDQPLVAPPPGLDVAPGALVFTLDGRLLAAAVEGAGGATRLAPAKAFWSAAETLLAAGPPAPGDLGVEVVSITPALAQATGVARGVVVAWVRPGGPADGPLVFGDAIDRIDDRPVAAARDFEVRVRRAGPGIPLKLSVARRGERRDVTVTTGVPPPAEAPAAGVALGLTLRTRAGVGVEVLEVAPRSAGALAGLAPGDLITHIDDRAAPSAAETARRYTRAAPGTRFLLGVTRGPRRLVLVLEKS